jgi:poly(3-hydroxyalkanoate) synthetase
MNMSPQIGRRQPKVFSIYHLNGPNNAYFKFTSFRISWRKIRKKSAGVRLGSRESDMDPWELWTQSWSTGMDMWLHAVAAIHSGSDAAAMREEPGWTTPHHEIIDFASLRLRDFSPSEKCGQAALVVTPFALHDAAIADLAPGHSLIETLKAQGCCNLFLVEWKSATPQTKLNTIDSMLASLNVALDEIGSPVDLIGLCQGGWLSLVYAARFPKKVRRLVLAGAPVDTSESSSVIFSRLAKQSANAYIDELVRRGDGLVLGRQTRDLWPGDASKLSRAATALELAGPPTTKEELSVVDAFTRWDGRTLDLPGPYYREVFNWLFNENRLVSGTFSALGRLINLKNIQHPLFLLAGEQDQIAPPASVLAAAALVGSRECDIESAVAPCGHHALIMGKRTLTMQWPRIADWLRQ